MTGSAATTTTGCCYERTKRDLAAREWKYVQHYADAKTDVVAAIMARALAEPDAR